MTISYSLNLGNPEEISIIELAKLIKRKINSSSEIEFRPISKEEPLRRPSIELAGRVLTWQPKVTLETGLNKTIDYLKTKIQQNDDNII